MKTKQKIEAASRMVALGLNNPDFDLVKVFQSTGAVFVSSPKLGNKVGIVNELTAPEQKLIQGFEKKYHAMVYHVIRNQTEFGVIYSFLYVSNTEKKWAQDRADLNAEHAVFHPFAYCYNVGPQLDNTKEMRGIGEFRFIGIKYGAGGLVRVE